MTKKYLIVGGSGFVGSFLIKELDKSRVQNLDKNPSPFYNDITTIGNICEINEISIPKGIETIILLAAEHRDDVSPTSLYYDVNVNGTKNVLRAMDKKDIKNLIFTSSVAIYGLNKKNPDENHAANPFNHYGKSKWIAENLIKEWYEKNSKEKSVTIIRPTVIFGERNRGNVFNLLKQVASRKFIMIGKGKNKKSMAYVGNVTRFIKFILEKNQKGFHVFNYADKPDFSMNEITQIIEKKMKIQLPKMKIPELIGLFGGYIFDVVSLMTNKSLPISSIRVKKFCATTQFDSSKALNLFKPPYTLREGIDKTLHYEFLNTEKDDILFYSK